MWVGGTAATNRDTIGCRWSEKRRGIGEGKYQTGRRCHHPWCLESQGDRIPFGLRSVRDPSAQIATSLIMF